MSMLLQNMKSECDAKGIGFTIAILPVMWDFQNYLFEKVNDVIVNFCKKQDIDYVDILPVLQGRERCELVCFIH